MALMYAVAAGLWSMGLVMGFVVSDVDQFGPYSTTIKMVVDAGIALPSPNEPEPQGAPL